MRAYDQLLKQPLSLPSIESDTLAALLAASALSAIALPGSSRAVSSLGKRRDANSPRPVHHPEPLPRQKRKEGFADHRARMPSGYTIKPYGCDWRRWRLPLMRR